MRFLIALAVLAVTAVAHAASDPALDYMLNCQGCHRADGGGTPGTIPPLSGSVARFLAVPGGREFLARVPGASQSFLDDARLAELLNWLVNRFDAAHVPKPFPAYTAGEIAALRKRPLMNVELARDCVLGRGPCRE